MPSSSSRERLCKFKCGSQLVRGSPELFQVAAVNLMVLRCFYGVELRQADQNSLPGTRSDTQAGIHEFQSQ